MFATSAIKSVCIGALAYVASCQQESMTSMGSADEFGKISKPYYNLVYDA